MIVHFHKKEPYRMQPPLTSLIDIVFMLLIYFMLTTNFMVDEGIKVRLPQASASAPQVHRDLVVFIDRDARVWIGDQEVPEADLFRSIRDRLEHRRDKRVVVRADRNLVLNRAVHVMDVLKAAGAESLCLATEKSGE